MLTPTKLFKEAQFHASLTRYNHNLPILKEPLPEIAILGRSNVGKSTLINKICSRKDLARTSKTPGRTSELIVFKVQSVLNIIDMPGYGWAKTAQSNKARWGAMIKHYMEKSPRLTVVFILIDSRRGVGEYDKTIIQWLIALNIPYTLILTKVDKLKKAEQETIAKEVEESMMHIKQPPRDILLSSKIDGIRQYMIKSAKEHKTNKE